MRGSIVRRSRTSWALVLDIGRVNGKRKQRWRKFTVRRDEGLREATKRAQAELAKLLGEVHDGTLVDATRITLGEYLTGWASKVAPMRRPSTARGERNMIRHVVRAPIGGLPLQRVRASDVEAFYAGVVGLGPASLATLHAVLHRALKTAVRDRLIAQNPAAAVERKPQPKKDHGEGARLHCWSASDARAFLASAREAGTQDAAFFTLALDTGGRLSELIGVTWDRVDLDAGTVTIDRQLDEAGHTPKWAPTKTQRSRVVVLGADTVSRLRTHKSAQAALKMANRTTYADHGLVFAVEEADRTTSDKRLGDPCLALPRRHYDAIVKAAGVRRIKFHGLRHTAATLLLAAGVPVQVVAERLGHSTPVMTLSIYAHATPNLQADAAARLGAVLAAGR
jgi:integrase